MHSLCTLHIAEAVEEGMYIAYKHIFAVIPNIHTIEFAVIPDRLVTKSVPVGKCAHRHLRCVLEGFLETATKLG